MSSAAESPSEEGDQLEAAGIVEGMDNVNLDADFSLELLTQHFNDSTATPGDKENQPELSPQTSFSRSLPGQLRERLQRSVQVPQSLGHRLWLGRQ